MELKLGLTGRQIEALWSVLQTSEYWAVVHGIDRSPRNLAVRKVGKVLGPLMDVVPGDQAVIFDLDQGEIGLLDAALVEELVRALRDNRWDIKVHSSVCEVREMLGAAR